MKPTTRILSEAAVLVALAGALNFVKIYALPQGGSITAGAMVPICWFALRRGVKWGVFAGVVFGFVVMLNPVDFYVVHPAQFLLDYPIAFGALGLAGAFRRHPLVGVGVGIFGRFLSHFSSGVIFFFCLFCNIQRELPPRRIRCDCGDNVPARQEAGFGVVSVGRSAKQEKVNQATRLT
jgi:energy-coupled thiamine transporter ThiT